MTPLYATSRRRDVHLRTRREATSSDLMLMLSAVFTIEQYGFVFSLSLADE
jgi:hypothetical protein